MIPSICESFLKVRATYRPEKHTIILWPLIQTLAIIFQAFLKCLV